MTRRACPHAEVRFCPLYIAGHDGTHPFGCAGDGLPYDECEVDRGAMDYAEEKGRIEAVDRLMVAQAAWKELKAKYGREKNA